MPAAFAVVCLAAAMAVPLPAQWTILDASTQTRFPEPRRMLRSHLTRIAMDQLAARRAAVAAIQTPAQFETRRAEFRNKLLAMMGGLPRERPPLEVKRTGRLDRGDYRVEKIVYQSQPNLFVTANLYVPRKGKPPYPAVLHSVGHSLTAKNRGFYQTLSIGLARHGFVVLTYDPAGQGERRIFFDKDLEDSKVGGATVEHEMVGVHSLLAGESIARHMVWDGMRGIDLLESLPEVDAGRIGATGCSGGGTLTTYLAAVDARVRVAAPACYITSWEDQLEADTGPQDAEQQFPELLASGYDHADYVMAFAPKPYLICSTDQDFFPVSGARKAFEEARRIYGLLGAGEKVDWFHEPGGHGMPQANREAVYGWMKRWLAGGPPGPASEPSITVEHEEDLNATPTGQVATSLGGETVSTLNLRRFAGIPPSRAGALRDAVARLTRFGKPARPPEIHEAGKLDRDGYAIERLVLSPPGGRFLPAALALPKGPPPARTVLYVGDVPAASAFTRAGDLARLVEAGYAVLAVDVSGRGETASNWRSYSEPWFGSQEKEAWLAFMTGRTLVGLRAEDIVSALDALAARGLLPAGGVAGFGKGAGAVDLLHAAALDPRIGRLALEDMLISYAAVARAPIHRRILDAVVPGVLGQYDLPELAASLAPRPVALVNARSPMGNVLPSAQAAKEYRSHVRVGLRRESDSVWDAFPELR